MSIIQTPNGYNLYTTGQRIVIDPVTRIEGHMRCEVILMRTTLFAMQYRQVPCGAAWKSF